MSKKEIIELIRQKCIKSNPDILKLEFGCKTKHGIYCGEDTVQGEYFFFLPDMVGSEDQAFQCEDFSRGSDIIGRDIRLADVLYAIDQEFLVDSSGRGWEAMCSLVVPRFIEGVHQKKPQWNLLKDRLEDQSEECIDFIYNLLK